MDRQTLESAATAVVGIAALALAAATLSSPVQRPAGGAGGGTEGFGRPRGGLPEIPAARSSNGLLELLVTLLVLALLAYGVYYLAVNYRVDVAIVVLAVVVTVALLALLSGFDPLSVTLPTVTPPDIDPGGSGGADGRVTGPANVPTALLVVVGAAVLAVGVIALRRRGGAATETTEEDDPADAASVARAAGEAADRIDEGGGVENEVYRAWREMTELLSLESPGTRTPGEFADAAVEAGIDRDDVAELTRLFEDVRYGDDEPTGETERRARDVFRRIEAAYGDEST